MRSCKRSASAWLAGLVTAGMVGWAAPAAAVTGSISGTVTDEAGAPLASVCVSAFKVDSSPWATPQDKMKTTFTASNGSYVLDGLEPGDHKVAFNQCGAVIVEPQPFPGPADRTSSPPPGGSSRYLGEWFDDQPDFESANPVAVSLGVDTPGIDAALTLGGSIIGRVTDPQGTPIASVCVYAYPDDGVTSGFGYTGPDGTFSMSPLETGEYRVGFMDCSYPTRFKEEWFNDKPDAASADLVAVTEGSVTSGIDAELARVPIVDLAITDLTIRNVPVTSDFGDVGYTGWMRKVNVSVSNLGETDAEMGSLQVEVCPATAQRCWYLGDEAVMLDAGEKRTYSFDWNGLGHAGDVKVNARLWSWNDQDQSNNSASKDHYVVVGGTGFGI